MTEIGVLPATAMLYAAETCPSGFVTTTGTALPGMEMLPVALKRVEETKAVASAVPFSFTVAPVRKLLPFTVRVKLPVLNGFGVAETIIGAGYLIVMVADSLLAGAAALVAVTVTVAGFGTTDGAEYNSVELTYPI